MIARELAVRRCEATPDQFSRLPTDLNAWSRTTCQRGDSTDVAGIPIRQV